MTGEQKPGGLEVVAFRWKGFDGYYVVGLGQPKPFDAEPLTPAEHAEARIRELELQRDEAVREALNATPFSRDEVRQMCEQRDELIAAAEARATAAEAKLARAVEGLERIAGQSGDAGEKVWSDRAWLNFREVAIQTLDALQQEGE